MTTNATDILREINEGKISLEKAEEIYDEIMSSPATNVSSLLGLTKAEWTAFGHGAGFDDLVKWRYNGWPACSKCGNSINIDKFGWSLKEKKGGYNLYHLFCPENKTVRVSQEPFHQNAATASFRISEELIEKVSRETNIPPSKVSIIVNEILKIISKSLQKGETINLHNFGRFFVRHKPETRIKSPGTGKIIQIPARHTPVFQPSTSFKKFVSPSEKMIRRKIDTKSEMSRRAK
jgi:nucleoid DNA-binding protein